MELTPILKYPNKYTSLSSLTYVIYIRPEIYSHRVILKFFPTFSRVTKKGGDVGSKT